MACIIILLPYMVKNLWPFNYEFIMDCFSVMFHKKRLNQKNPPKLFVAYIILCAEMP